MPRPTLPPTPGSSSDIKGKEGPQFGSQMAFELPPPAMLSAESRPSSASAKSSSASSYRPNSPQSPILEKKTAIAPAARRRSSAEKVTSKDAFALPPPPTRSRKIIQMKPRGQADDEAGIDGMDAKAGPIRNTGTQSKKKQPSATSVAGRKIARKTAHSLIERRRRSKMNEEFGVLKNMIPACTGEMHKLAILQASIDYVRYLEDCVAKLKAQNNHRTPTPDSRSDYIPPPPAARESFDAGYGGAYEDEDEDVEMDGSDAASPAYTPEASHSNQPTPSPALLAQDGGTRYGSISSASNDPRHYSYSTSTITSPAFGPRSHEYATSNASGPHSTLTSPALLPQRDRDLDQEATTALLMLNTDRRGTNGSGGGRGMSVRDLLST